MSQILFQLSLDCWLASMRVQPEDPEELYRQLLRTSYAFHTSLQELRDELLISCHRRVQCGRGAPHRKGPEAI